MSPRARVLFIIVSLILLLVFEVSILRGRSEAQLEFDQTVEDILHGASRHSVALELQHATGSLWVFGNTSESEEVLRVLNLMSAADIFSKGSRERGSGGYRFTVRIDDGGREFSVWIARSELERDLRARNLLKIFQLLGRPEKMPG